MSKPDIFVPIFIGDYVADTMRFNTQDHGAYVLLIMDYWRCGPPPDDQETLLGITKLRGRGAVQCLLKVLTKFTLVDGFWHHKRIDEELQNASIQQANASEKGRKAAAARWGKAEDPPDRSDATGIAQALPMQCSLPSPSHIEDQGGESTTSRSSRAREANGPAPPLPENFDGRIFDLEKFDRRSGRAPLKKFPFVWFTPDEIAEAKKVWRELNGLSQDDWVLGMRRLNAHGESKRGGLRDGSAFKQLTGFILTDALEQRKKKPSTNGTNGVHPPRGKAYEVINPRRAAAAPESVGEVLRKAQSAKPEGATHGKKS